MSQFVLTLYIAFPQIEPITQEVQDVVNQLMLLMQQEKSVVAQAQQLRPREQPRSREGPSYDQFFYKYFNADATNKSLFIRTRNQDQTGSEEASEDAAERQGQQNVRLARQIKLFGGAEGNLLQLAIKKQLEASALESESKSAQPLSDF